MHNPLIAAKAIADLGNLNQENILGLVQEASLACDNVLNASAPVVAPSMDPGV